MNIDMIRAAQKRLNGHAHVTPLLSSPFVDEIAGRRVFLKAEPLQHTGSFKFRGAWSAVSALPKQALIGGILAYSSGNHAQGVAMAARAHGAPVVIVMPSDAPAIKTDNTRALGAEIVLYDRDADDRDAIGDALARERDLTLIKPFDEPLVIAGQGTVGLELLSQTSLRDADVLVCCGGGGLTSGIALALENSGLRVRPVEPTAFDDVTRSLAAGERKRNATTSGSLCDAIISPEPGKLTFPIMKRLCGSGIVVPEEDCLRAMVVAYAHLKIVLEPGGAIALAAALYHPDQISGDDVIAIASGGNVDPDIFMMALDKHRDAM